MAERQESRQAREHFQTFLRGQGVSESTVGVYSGALGKIGGGTRLLQINGLCPPDRTVLELTGPDAEKIAVWWTAEKRKSVTKRSVRLAIDNYLVWRGAAPEKKEEAVPASKTPRFSPAEHGLTLGLCLRSFCAGSTEPRRETMTRLLRILLGNPRYEYGERSGEDLAEESSRYPALRETLLERLEKKDALAAALEDAFFDSLTDCARALLGAVKQRCAKKLLEDYAHRDDPFAGSIPAALSDLYAASRGGAARDGSFGEAGPYLTLLEAVARDGETAYRRRSDVPEEFGAALKDPALWQQGLLPDWLEEVIDWKNPPAQAEMDALYAAAAAMDLKSAENARRVERLLARLLSGFTGDFTLPEEAAERGTLAQAAENAARAARIYRACPEECARALEKKRSGTWCIPQPSVLFAVPERSVYEAKLLTYQAELLCRLAEREKRPGKLLRRSEEALRRAEELEQENDTPSQRAWEKNSGTETLGALRMRTVLRRAELLCRLAEIEGEGLPVSDVCTLYADPCLLALATARQEAETLQERERVSAAAEDCFDALFGTASQTFRAALVLPGEDGLFEARQNQWRSALGLTPKAPLVLRALTKEELAQAEEDAGLFRPVYSNVFDSVAGRERGEKEKAERALVQLLLSGYTCLFTMPMLCDNRNLLNLLSQPGFSQILRRGAAAVSPYGSVRTPLDYVIGNLKRSEKQIFHWSCCDVLNRRDALGRNCREALYLILTENRPASLLPLEARNELAGLADSWRTLNAALPPSVCRRYDQNIDRRWPPREPGTKSLTLGEVLHREMDILKRSASPEGQADARCFASYLALWREANDRSALEERIRTARRSAELSGNGEETARLDRFWELVGESYHEALGSLCCRDVRLYRRGKSCLADTADPNVSARLWQSVSTATPEGVQVDWENFPDLLETVRETETALRKRDAELRALKKELETGLTFAPVGNQAELTDFTVRTSEGKILRTAPEVPQNSSEVAEQKREY